MPNSFRHAGTRPRPGHPSSGALPAAAAQTAGSGLPCAVATPAAPTWEELLGQR